MPIYQRVYIPVPSDYPNTVYLYGFVEINPETGDPIPTFCCSVTPTPYVHGVGYSGIPEADDDGTAEGGYFNLSVVRSALTGEAFAAADDDEAREECQSNW